MLNKSTYRVVEDVDPYRSLRIKLTDKSKFEKTRNPPLVWFPEPLRGAFWSQSISPSAEGDQRTRAGAAVAFCKKRRKNLKTLRT